MLIWSRDLTAVTKKNSSREPSDKWSPINASSSLKKFSLLEKVENFFTLWQQNKGSITTGAKTSHRVKIREYFYHSFTPKLCVAHKFSPMQERVHAAHITCVFENMSKWRNQQLLFQKSPQVFQGGAHTLCKINESNNDVGRATVFDTKKRCDE
jgi:hypothetical protein